MSYVNMIMYGAVIPSPHYEKDGKGGKKADRDVVRADDPANRQRVRDFLDGIKY